MLHTEWAQEFKLCSLSVLCSGVQQALLWMMLVRNDLLYAVMFLASNFVLFSLRRIELWSCNRGNYMGFNFSV